MRFSNRGLQCASSTTPARPIGASRGSLSGFVGRTALMMGFALAATACGDDADPADGGSLDVGMDAGSPDTGPKDTGEGDSGAPDTGPEDMGDGDGGTTDTGAEDMGGADGGTPDPLEIVGVYASQFGQEEVITEALFNSAAIRAYDNATNVLITQNSTTAEFGPGLFNRIEWIDLADDTFYYCFVDFGLETFEAAQNSMMTADPSDPDNRGCGMFPWTRLRRAVSIRGRYLSNFGGMETITATSWQQSGPPMRIADWSEMDNWVVTQNSSEAMFFPSLYNRLDFTTPDASGSFYYCFVDFGLMTADEARTSTQTADATDPENSGCGGFPWTRLDPR